MPAGGLNQAIARSERDAAEMRSVAPLNRVMVLPSIPPRTVLVSTLAREIVMYGEDLSVVAAAYNVEAGLFASLVESNTALGREVDGARKEMGQHSRIEMRFRDLIDSEFYIIAETIRDPKTSPETRLKAFSLAADLAGLSAKKTPASTGTTPQAVNILVAGVKMRNMAGVQVIDGTTADRITRQADAASDDLDPDGIEDFLAGGAGLDPGETENDEHGFTDDDGYDP